MPRKPWAECIALFEKEQNFSTLAPLALSRESTEGFNLKLFFVGNVEDTGRTEAIKPDLPMATLDLTCN